MTTRDTDSPLYPNDGDAEDPSPRVSRRRMLTGSAAAGAVLAAGCTGDDGGTPGGGATGADERTTTDGATGSPERQPTVFVFNTGDGTVSLIDPGTDELLETRAIGLSSSFPSNQYTRTLTDRPADALWLNVGRGVRGLAVGSLQGTAAVETGSGANWLEQTPDGDHVVVSAREPAHAQFRIDADTDSDTFGEVTGRIERADEGGTGDREGPGPCDVTVHPSGDWAYVPDIFGDTLTVLGVDPFEVVAQVEVDPVGDSPARPWMGTVSPDGNTWLVEHDEGETGTESVWDLRDPTDPQLAARLTADDGLGTRPLTSEIGPDSRIGYVFTPGAEDVTVVDMEAGSVTDRIDLGGSAFVGTWNPDRTKLYAPVQTNDEVAVIDHEAGELVERISVGANPYGATAAEVRPRAETTPTTRTAMAQLGIGTETTYCIGECACGHQL